MPRKKWQRPLLKVEVRSLPAGQDDWLIHVTSFGKSTSEVCQRVEAAVRAEMKLLLVERKIQQQVADIELPFNGRFRPWIGKLLSRFAKRH